MDKHFLKWIKSLNIHYERKEISVDVYKCKICKKFKFYDKETYEPISFNGALGEEIKD